MRKKFLLLMLLVAFGLVAGTAQANMLLNPSFEDGAFTPNATPVYWTLYSTYSPTTITWHDDADGAHSGDKYVQVKMRKGGGSTWLMQTVEVTVGQEYAFGVWAKSPAEDRLKKAWGYYEFTEPNDTLDLGYRVISDGTLEYWDWVEDGWEQAYFGSQVAPAGATHCIFSLTGVGQNGVDGILFDDARMTDKFAKLISPKETVGYSPYDVVLSWTNMVLDPNDPDDPNLANPVTSVYVDVWFGTDPNNPDTKVVTTGEDANSVTVEDLPVGSYFWRVNSYINGASHINEPNAIEGFVWSFKVSDDFVPSFVDAGTDMITWSGESVTLDPNITDDGRSPLTYHWTADDPNVVFDPNEFVLAPTVTIIPDIGTIPVVNPGLENPVLSDGVFISHTAVEGWVAGYYGLTSGTWYDETGQNSGAINPDSKYGYDGKAPGGQNIAKIETFGSYRMGLSQTLPATLQPNTTYNLSLKAGTPDVQAKGGYAVELLAGHTVVMKLEGSAPHRDAWIPLNQTIHISADDENDPNFGTQLGKELKIRLLTAGDVYKQGSDLNFDDVLLISTSTTVSPYAVPVTLMLTVGDEGNPLPVSDATMTDVYENECMAALGAGLGKPADIVANCITEIEDLSEMLLTWLDDKRVESHHKPAGDIYFDDFDGDGSETLHETAPDIRPDDETWISSPEWNNDGTNSANYITALLPFIPSADNVYQLSATLDVTAATEEDKNWFALGFAQDNNTRNWVTSTNPVGWILNRVDGTSRSSLGPNNAGSVEYATTDEPYDFMIELNTNPEPWTVEWFAAPAGEPLVSIRGPVAFTEDPNINHVAFGASGNDDKLSGSVDNFKLHEGPIPGGDPVDAGSSWATSTGESITVDDAVAPAGTYLWTADPDTDVEITGAATLTPTVTFTGSTTDNPTIIELTLDVDSGSASDTTKIYIYDDSCRAAIGAGEELDPADFDADCQTRLEDFAVIAEAWLVDYELTGPVEKP